MSEERKIERFRIRPDRAGWTVFDVWTGEPSVIAMRPQTSLTEAEAEHTAELLNRRARSGDRSMRQ